MNKIIEEPKKEDYGYEPGGLENEGGWMLEGGEEAYYKALDEYKRKLKLVK